MIYVALIALVLLAVTSATFARTVHWTLREHARERNLMLNQLMHLVGRTWQPPPAAEPDPQAQETVAYVDPSHLPDWE